MKVNEIIGIYTAAIADAAAYGTDSVPVSELERVNPENCGYVARGCRWYTGNLEV